MDDLMVALALLHELRDYLRDVLRSEARDAEAALEATEDLVGLALPPLERYADAVTDARLREMGGN